MRILVLQHDADKGLGLLGPPLAAGAELDVRRAGAEPVALDGHAGVVALPGLADPPDDTPAVRETRDVLAAALAAGVPVLGICLGAELLAEAAGGRTGRSEPEFGYHALRLLPAARDDALLAGLPPALDAFQAHAYAVVEPPAGAVELARSDACLQAFRLGRRAWGLQFHPEAAPEMIAGWLEAVPAFRAHGVDPDATAARARAGAARWRGWTAAIAAGFLDVCRAYAPIRHSSPGRTHATSPPQTTTATGLRPKR